MKFYKQIIISTALIIAIVLSLYYYVGGYKKYFYEVENCSVEHGVSLPLILAVIKTESNFNPSAVSSKGAVGLMQIMPKTASFVCSIYGVEEKSLLEANFNILVGTLYIKYLLQKFGSERLAILAYNAGEGRVISWIESGQIDNVPYRETKSYCKKIFARKRAYKAIIEF